VTLGCRKKKTFQTILVELEVVGLAILAAEAWKLGPWWVGYKRGGVLGKNEKSEGFGDGRSEG